MKPKAFNYFGLTVKENIRGIDLEAIETNLTYYLEPDDEHAEDRFDPMVRERFLSSEPDLW